jgi:hypothetical protein
MRPAFASPALAFSVVTLPELAMVWETVRRSTAYSAASCAPRVVKARPDPAKRIRGEQRTRIRACTSEILYSWMHPLDCCRGRPAKNAKRPRTITTLTLGFLSHVMLHLHVA